MTNRKLHNSCTGCVCDFITSCGMGYARKPVSIAGKPKYIPVHACEKPNDTFELLELLRDNEPKTQTERTPENGEDSEND